MPTLVPRSTWHPGPPTNNNGSTRPKLARPVAGGLAVHYTGAPIRPRASTDDAQVYMPWQQAYALSAGKSFEYNDIIPPRADGSSQVWEYAGEYMAAHAGSINNSSWYAIQLAIGVNNHPSQTGYDPNRPTFWQPLDPAQIDAFRWRRAELVKAGLLAPDHQVREHRQLPNAATTCPGEWVRAHWPELLQPWKEPDDMALRIFKVEATPMPSPPPLFASGDGLTAVWLSAAQHAALGAPPWEDRAITRAEARKYTLIGDCPNGYRGIWGQDALT